MNGDNGESVNKKNQRDILCCLKSLQSGDEAAFADIYEMYKPLMRSMVNHLITQEFPGEGNSEYDDVIQEATMSLYKAAKAFDTEKTGITFGLYAKICIRNRLISAKRKIIREQKNKQKLIENKKAQKQDTGKSTPDKRRHIDLKKLNEAVDNSLSDFEKQVFRLYAGRMSYKEIAATLQRSEKAVDNAVYRIKCKLKKHV